MSRISICSHWSVLFAATAFSLVLAAPAAADVLNGSMDGWTVGTTPDSWIKYGTGNTNKGSNFAATGIPSPLPDGSTATWNGSNYTMSPSTANFERIEVTRTGPGTTYCGSYQQVSVLSGTEYTLTGYVYVRGAGTNATSQIRLGLENGAKTAPGTPTWSTVESKNGSNVSSGWIVKTVSLTPTGSTLTVFVDGAVISTAGASAVRTANVFADTLSLAAACSPQPVAPTSASNNGPICNGSSATLTAGGGAGSTLRWLTGSCAGTSVGTGNNLVVNPTSDTTYYARWETACGNSTCASTTVTVRAVPTATAGADQAIFANGTTAGLGGNTPSSPATGAWSVVGGGTGTFNPNNSTPDATFTHTGGAGPITLRWTVSNSPCTPATDDVAVTINPAPPYCLFNGSFDSGFGGNGWADGWTRSGTDGTWAKEEGSSFVHSACCSQKITDAAGGSSYTSWLYQAVSVQPGKNYVPTMWIYRVGSALARIGVDPNAGTTFTASDGAPTSGQWTYRVHDAFTAGVGGVATLGLAAGFQTDSGTIYYDDVAVKPQAPQTTGGATTICSGSSTNITASGGYQASADSQLKWYTAPNGGGALAGSGSPLSVSPASTTTYYPRWETGDSCGVSDDGAGVTVTVNASPVAPTSASNNGPVCQGANATLSYAGGSGTTLKWYSDAGCTALVGSGQNLSVGPLNSDTQYWARWETASCGNSGTVTTTVTVTAAPADRTVTAQATSVTSGTGTNIQVAASETGVSYQLKTEAGTAVGGPVAGDGNTINLPTGNLTVDTQFKVEATGSSPCLLMTTLTNHPWVYIGPTITDWSSVKTQGVNTYDVAMDPSKTGTGANSPLIEPRRGDLLIRVLFSADVATITSGDVTVQDQDNNIVTPASVTQPDATTLEIVLSNPYTGGSPYPLDGKRLTLELAGTVHGTSSVSAVLLGDRDCQVRCLVGDVNQGSSVNATDISVIRDAIRPVAEGGFNGVVSPTNTETLDLPASWLCDVNTNGSINVVDMALVRSRVGNSVP